MQLILKCHDWQSFARDGWDVYFYANVEQTSKKIHKVPNLLESNAYERLAEFLMTFRGQFSIIAKKNQSYFLIADIVNSIPLYFINQKNKTRFITDSVETVHFHEMDKDEGGLIQEFLSSGYLLNGKCLYKPVTRTQASQILTIKREAVSGFYYYSFHSEKNKPFMSYAKTKEEFKKVYYESIGQSLYDLSIKKPIVLPLSAGADSRLIASILKANDIKNVILYTYGSRNSYEIQAARSIAKKLGFRWIAIEYTLAQKRRFFTSHEYSRYVDSVFDYCVAPSIHDVYENHLLAKEIDIANVTFVNGSTGDFLSGGHLANYACASSFDGQSVLLEPFIKKNYRILGQDPNNDELIAVLKNLLDSRGWYSASLKDEYKLENLELITRQSLFIMSQLRSYEYHHADWYLPFWDIRSVNFWSKVPFYFRQDQKAYQKLLIDLDEFGIFKDVAVNQKTIEPFLLRQTRLLFKFFFLPLPREHWHNFDRRGFKYFYHPTFSRSVISYLDILTSKYNVRNSNGAMVLRLLKDGVI